MSSVPLITIAIVEDDTVVREFLAAAVASEQGLDLIAATGTVTEALTVLATTPPRVFLVDLTLPDGSGLEVIRAAAELPSTDTMVISVLGDEHSAISALRGGARGYLLKDELGESIVDQVRAVVAGESPISPAIARYLLRQFEARSGSMEPPLVDPLTAREIDVLKLVARGYKRAEIATRLSISVNTVSTHIRQLYSKLAVVNNVEATRSAARLGLIPDE